MTLFYDYEETYKILNEKFNITHDELKYYSLKYCNNQKKINKLFETNYYSYNYICSFISDLPISFHEYHKGYDSINYGSNPELGFYYKKNIDNYNPPKKDRFVYIKDLAGKRNWPRHMRSETNLFSEFPALDDAAKNNLIRFFDPDKKEFTFIKEYHLGDDYRCHPWIATIDGQEYLSQPDNFFLLQDIIKIERIFYKRPLEDCLIELEIDPKEYI